MDGPPDRMKAGRNTVSPFEERPCNCEGAAQGSRFGFRVSGQRSRFPLSSSAMEMLLRRLKADAFTVHGFRSAFRDWVGDATGFSREVAEAALAHRVGDETERAYRRSDALEKRRKLMRHGRITVSRRRAPS